MKFAKTMPQETVRDQTQSEMDHASLLFTPIYGKVYESRYSSDTGSESSDDSVVMSTRPEMRKPEMRGASIYMSGRTTHRESGISIGADLGLNTSDGFRKIITPEISKVVKYTPFPDDDHEIKPNFSGDFFDRYSDDPEEKKNRVRSRWSFFVSETLAISNIVKYNEVVQAINWARWANALVELDNQKAVQKNNKPSLLKKSMQVVATGAGLGLGAAATTVQTGLGAAATTVQTSWSFGKAVVGAVVGLGKKPDQTRRKHTRFDESGDGQVVEEVVVRSENQMQVDLQAGSVCEEPSPAPPPATGTGASKAPVPPALPNLATGTGASTGLKSPAPPKPATRLDMMDEMKNKIAARKKINDEEAEKTKANTAARILADQEAAVHLAENGLYLHAWLDSMPYNDPNGGACVQKLYMAHKNAKPEPHVTASGKRGKDPLIASLMLLTTEHRLEKFPWE